MTEWTLKYLQSKVLERNLEWMNKRSMSLDFHLIELFGETGEALNCVKKLLRAKEGIAGGVTDTAHLAEELADVVICYTLVQIALGHDGVSHTLEVHTHEDAGELPEAYAKALGVAVGHLVEIASDQAGLSTSQIYFWSGSVLRWVTLLARAYDIDLMQAVPAKFNATSTKMNLKTRML